MLTWLTDLWPFCSRAKLRIVTAENSRLARDLDRMRDKVIIAAMRIDELEIKDRLRTKPRKSNPGLVGDRT